MAWYVIKPYASPTPVLTAAGWTAIVGSEAGFFNVLVQFWAEGSLPLPASSKLTHSEWRVILSFLTISSFNLLGGLSGHLCAPKQSLRLV